jgi:excisionase family DNA binding protein
MKENAPTITPELLTVEQAAQYLNLSPRTIYNGVAPNSLNPFPVSPKRIGRKVLFRKKDLDAFIDAL